jgi:hypothetical protein
LSLACRPTERKAGRSGSERNQSNTESM